METQHGLFIHPSSDTSGWAWDVEPIVRVTLIRDEQESLEFPPVSFELQKNGRSVVIQGAPRDDVDNWKGSVRYEDKDIIIANPTVMRDGHVEIWCDEAQRVSHHITTTTLIQIFDKRSLFETTDLSTRRS